MAVARGVVRAGARATAIGAGGDWILGEGFVRADFESDPSCLSATTTGLLLLFGAVTFPFTVFDDDGVPLTATGATAFRMTGESKIS